MIIGGFLIFDLIYGSENFDLDGSVNGKIRLIDLYNSPNLLSDISIEEFYFNKIHLGDAVIKTSWDNTNESLSALFENNKYW